MTSSLNCLFLFHLIKNPCLEVLLESTRDTITSEDVLAQRYLREKHSHSAKIPRFHVYQLSLRFRSPLPHSSYDFFRARNAENYGWQCWHISILTRRELTHQALTDSFLLHLAKNRGTAYGRHGAHAWGLLPLPMTDELVLARGSSLKHGDYRSSKNYFNRALLRTSRHYQRTTFRPDASTDH